MYGAISVYLYLCICVSYLYKFRIRLPSFWKSYWRIEIMLKLHNGCIKKMHWQNDNRTLNSSMSTIPISNPNLHRHDVQIGERTFEVIPQFTYIGSKISNNNSMMAVLRARMLAANRSFWSLKNQFTSKNLSRRTTPLRHGHCSNLTKPS